MFLNITRFLPKLMNCVENDVTRTDWFSKGYRILLGLIDLSKNGLKLQALPSISRSTAEVILLFPPNYKSESYLAQFFNR